MYHYTYPPIYQRLSIVHLESIYPSIYLPLSFYLLLYASLCSLCLC